MGEGGQCPVVVGLGSALHDEAVDEAAALAAASVHVVGAGAEPDADADAGLGGLGELLGDGVVPELVEVEHALVHEDPGDGQLGGEGGPAPGARLRLGRLGLRLGDHVPDQRELLRRAARLGFALAVVPAHSSILTKRHRQWAPSRDQGGRRRVEPSFNTGLAPGSR